MDNTRMGLDEFFETIDNAGNIRLAIVEGLRAHQVPQMVEPYFLSYLQLLGDADRQLEAIETFRPDDLGYVI